MCVMRLCVHSSKPYVFLSLFSEYDLEDADQCVVMNTGKKSGGLWSAESISCSMLICLQHIKRAVDIKIGPSTVDIKCMMSLIQQNFESVA